MSIGIAEGTNSGISYGLCYVGGDQEWQWQSLLAA